MLDDLQGHTLSSIAFHDRIPYVLDLLAGVTRTIDDESRGHRTAQFSSWWMEVDRSIQKSIQDMRNAELKKLIPLTTPRLESLTNVSVADYPGTSVNDGDTLVKINWLFKGGTFHGQPVIDTLREYLQHLGELLREAELKLRL
jgi:hypothetical protein